ncbi:MAG: YraN family protein [Ardenticatenales bacterium]|nr:YraN family protein [Ardenticatenales bacterium]
MLVSTRSVSRVAERRQLGQWGERYAAQMLAGKGYRLLAQNWRCPAGEMDLIMQDGDALVFVEVKTRRGGWPGSPESALTEAKVTRLFAIVEHYLLQHDLSEECEWRVDAVAVELAADGTLRRCQHWPALSLDG